MSGYSIEALRISGLKRLIYTGGYLSMKSLYILFFYLLKAQTTHLLSAAARRDCSFESSAETNKNDGQYYV